MRPYLPFAAAVLLFSCSHAAPAPASGSASTASAENGGWIARSNQNAQLLLDVQAQFAPEFAARTGVAGIDDRISHFMPRHPQPQRAAPGQGLGRLRGRQEDEEQPDG